MKFVNARFSEQVASSCVALDRFLPLPLHPSNSTESCVKCRESVNCKAELICKYLSLRLLKKWGGGHTTEIHKVDRYACPAS